MSPLNSKLICPKCVVNT
jgi:hypothetical protein